MIRVIPITLREANAFVQRHHRHHAPARGCIFVLAVADGHSVRGVAIVGRPLDVPPSYRGTRILSHVSMVYGDPPRPPGTRVWSSESTSASREGMRARRDSPHPCPMALDHARWLVRWFGYGCTILDPFAGGGTVLRAAVELGQQAIGIECDERWIPTLRDVVDRAGSQVLIGTSAEGWR